MLYQSPSAFQFSLIQLELSRQPTAEQLYVTQLVRTQHTLNSVSHWLSQAQGEERGDSNVKRLEMLIISLRGVNLAFWGSHLGRSGQNATILSSQSIV